MITINPIKINSKVTFGETPNAKVTSSTAILALQSPSAQLGFQKDYLITHKADAVGFNPVTAIVYKFVKACNELSSHNRDGNYPRVSFMA
jgi:hypothetical protein